MAETLPRRDFAVLFAALLTVAAGNTALQTVVPTAAREIHVPDMAVAGIFSLSAVLWTFSAPYWARQSDLRGRRRLVLVGLAGFAVSMTGCGIAMLAGLTGVLAPIASFGLFTVLRTLFGIFGSASNPAAQAYVAARTSHAERTNALSTMASAFGLGTILGPALAPLFIIGAAGLAGPLFAFAVIALVVLAAVRLLLPDDDPSHAIHPGHGAPSSEPTLTGGATGGSAMAATLGRSPRLSWRDPRVLPFMIFGFVSGSVQAATGAAIGFLVIDRLGRGAVGAQSEIAIVFMAGAGATLIAQWGLIRMFAMTPSQLIRWGTAIAAIGTAGIALAPNFHALVVAYALAALGYGFARPGFTAGASLAVTQDEQGGVAGAVTAINGACFVAAPAVGIGLYQLGASLPYELGAAALVLLLGYAIANKRIES